LSWRRRKWWWWKDRGHCAKIKEEKEEKMIANMQAHGTGNKTKLNPDT